MALVPVLGVLADMTDVEMAEAVVAGLSEVDRHGDVDSVWCRECWALNPHPSMDPRPAVTRNCRLCGEIFYTFYAPLGIICNACVHAEQVCSRCERPFTK